MISPVQIPKHFSCTRRRSTLRQLDVSPPHLCGLSDRSQLQVFGVAPPVQLSVSGHSQAAVSVRADLLNLHPRQIPSHLHRTGADVVMSQTWKMTEKITVYLMSI